MATSKTICKLLSVSFLFPGLICFASLMVPAFQGTHFFDFAVKWWWALFFYGSILCIISMLTCQFLCRD